MNTITHLTSTEQNTEGLLAGFRGAITLTFAPGQSLRTDAEASAWRRSVRIEFDMDPDSFPRTDPKREKVHTEADVVLTPQRFCKPFEHRKHQPDLDLLILVETILGHAGRILDELLTGDGDAETNRRLYALEAGDLRLGFTDTMTSVIEVLPNGYTTTELVESAIAYAERIRAALIDPSAADKDTARRVQALADGELVLALL